MLTMAYVAMTNVYKTGAKKTSPPRFQSKWTSTVLPLDSVDQVCYIRSVLSLPKMPSITLYTPAVLHNGSP